jgi:hypothetical protein
MKVILMVFLMLAGSASVFSQQVSTAFSKASQSFDVKTLSLASATVSLGGDYSDAKINPAGIGTEGILNLSVDVDFFINTVRVEHQQYSLEGDYKFGKSAISFSTQLINSGEQVITTQPLPYQYKFQNKELFLKAGYAYSINEKLSLGMALNYLYSGEASGTSVSAELVEPVDTWSVDLGVQYQFSRKIEPGILKPSFGLALTNFGNGVNYYGGKSTSPLPIRLQAGAGFTFISNQKRSDRNIFELRVLQNVSNSLAQMERRETNSSFYLEAMNPFKALVKSWGNYEYFDGQKRVKSSLSEQISWHSGVEVKFVETFAVRWGLRKAGKYEEDRSYQSLGLGIDLFYMVLDYAFVFDKSDYRNFMEGGWWQLTGRIPLDGSRPDSILLDLFK